MQSYLICLMLCLQVGTGEIKDLLLHQCNIIYECKVCQNMFRGLANFIAHKRVYCQQQHNESRLPFVDTAQEQETVVVQPQPPPQTKEKEKPEWDDYIDTDDEIPPPKTEKPKMSVLEQMKKGIFKGSSPGYDFYTKAVERQQRKERNRKQVKISLHNVPGSASAVKQELENDEEIVVVEPKEAKGRGRPKKRKKLDGEDEPDPKVSRRKKETSPVVDGENVVVVEPKAATGHIRMNLRQRVSGEKNSWLEQLKKRSDCDTKTLECLKCKQSYATVKTLHFHMTSQHHTGGKRTFYPCPLCSAVFAAVSLTLTMLVTTIDALRHFETG